MRHFEIPHPPEVAWYGLPRKGCPLPIQKQLAVEMEQAHQRGAYSERECEVDCFLAVIQEAKCRKLVLLDIGTGWGEWSLALDGVVKNRIVPVGFRQYAAYALESDPQMWQAAYDNFRDNRVRGCVLQGAAHNHHKLPVRVNTGTISAQCCGGGLSFGNPFSGSALAGAALGVAHVLTRKTAWVQTYTLDHVVDMGYTPDSRCLVMMDIQGAEVRALEGARKAVAEGKVDWWLIGTHGSRLHKKVKEMLLPGYDLLVDAIPDVVSDLGDGYKVWCRKGQDGIQFWRRRGL